MLLSRSAQDSFILSHMHSERLVVLLVTIYLISMHVLVAFLLLLFTCNFVHSRTIEDTRRLYEHFHNMTKYKDARPILNQSDTIQVSFDFL